VFDLLDGVLMVALVIFGISGYRQGFIVGALSFIGFLGGAIVGAKAAPTIAGALGMSGRSALTGLVVVFLGAVVGQLLAGALAAALRQRLTWRSARSLDSAGGAVTSGISVLLVAWLLATAVARSPFTELRRQVQNSSVIAAVDSVVPDSARTWFSTFLQLVEQQGFPQVFSGIGNESVVPTRPPERALSTSATVQAVRPSIVKIRGTAPSCDRQVEGSGFVYAAERVMTNAHVVAGVRQPQVEVGGATLPARVVLFDPHRDVAVLLVPGLARRALPFAPTAASAGASAIVIGYPQDGPFTAVAARVRNRLRARGADIYSAGEVTRDIYGVRSRVLPGNSGGPLVSPGGAVYGVVFAAASDDPETGYVLTADEVASDAASGRTATAAVSTSSCD